MDRYATPQTQSTLTAVGNGSEISVVIHEKTAAKKNCKIVIKTGVLVRAKFCDGDKMRRKQKPPSRVSASPKPIVNACVSDTKPIPAIHNTAAVKL